MPRKKPLPRLSRIDEKVAKETAKARHVAMKQRKKKHQGRRRSSLLRASKQVKVVQPTTVRLSPTMGGISRSVAVGREYIYWFQKFLVIPSPGQPAGQETGLPASPSNGRSVR